MMPPNPPRTSAVWYGTLLRAHAALPEANLAQLAAQLGFQRQAKQQDDPTPSPTPISHNAQPAPRPTPPPALDQRRYHPLYVTQYQPQQPPPPVPSTTPEPLESIADLLQRGAEGQPLASEPLCRNAPLHTWLRAQYRTQRPGHRLDMPRIIRHIAQGRPLRRLPRQPQRHWPHTVHLWRSTRLALAPLQADYARIEQLLTQHIGAQRVQTAYTKTDPQQLQPKPPVRFRYPQPGDAVLILDDLTHPAWNAWGRYFQRQQIPAQALVPAGNPAPQRQAIHTTAMDHGRLFSTPRTMDLTPAVERLKTYTSPALFVEPSLLRAIRLQYPELPAAAEVALWQQADLCTTYQGYYFRSNPTQHAYQQRYATLPAPQKQRIGARILTHHAYWLTEPRAEETQQLQQCGTPLTPEARTHYQHFFQQLLQHQQQGSAPADTAHWLQHTGKRQHATHWEQSTPAYIQAYLHACRDELRAHPERWPPGLSTAYWDQVHHTAYPTQPTWLVANADGIQLQPDIPDHSSPTLTLQNDGNLRCSTNHATPHTTYVPPGSGPQSLTCGQLDTPSTWHLGNHQARYTLTRAPRPAWADCIGRDRYGLYAEFSVQGVTQRCRWINPGHFLMGSPPNEPKRRNNETQHPVTLTQGYWLADTACTQALWQAVLGKNPAEFQDNPQNPVEQVSWDDTQTFFNTLNRLIPDLNAGLPTEAQWEYACRAGTTGPFSFGDTITTAQANNDGNYPYADGKRGEYREQTMPVKAFPANPWGLYQMHGNVWEWCQDWSADYPAEPTIDPTGPSTGTSRVVRGGSWFNFAWYLRSAFRYWGGPGIRNYFIGFRLAPGQGQ